MTNTHVQEAQPNNKQKDNKRYRRQ